MSRPTYPVLSSECTTIASLSAVAGGGTTSAAGDALVALSPEKPIVCCEAKEEPFLAPEPNKKGGFDGVGVAVEVEVEVAAPKKDKPLVAAGMAAALAPAPTPAPIVPKEEPKGLLLPEGGKRPATPLLVPVATGKPDGAISCTAPNLTVAVAGTETGVGTGVTATSATIAAGTGVEEGTRSSIAISSRITASTCIASPVRLATTLTGAGTVTAGTGTGRKKKKCEGKV
jgi:hypothetical protein